MGILDRILAQPATPAPAPPAPTARTLDSRSITFAAQRIDPTVKPDKRLTAAAAKRSEEMWAAYETIGEIGYVVDFFGNAMRRVRVFPGGVEDPEQGVVPLDECSWASPQLAADAAALLDRVRSLEHGQGEVLSEMAKNLKVAGAGNLYAQTNDLGLEDWQVLSTSALVWHKGAWCIRRTPEDRKPEPLANPEQLWRFWQRHPRWPGLAYSEMSRVLGHAENLQLLERANRARARSRVAGAGMLLMSNRHAFKPAKPGQGDFFDDLLEHMTAPISDEGSVAAFAPMIVDVDADDVSKVAQHLTFDRPLSELEAAREELLLRRIGQGLDGPPELVTGFHDVKFANGVIIQQETYEAHLEPLAYRIADILAVTVLRSGLIALGYPVDLVQRVVTGVDPSDLVRRPAIDEDANEAHDRLVISDATYRRIRGFTDDDAPEMDELLRRMALKRGTTTEALTTELLEKYADADVSRVIRKVEAQTDAIEATAEESAGSTPEEPAGSPDDDVTAAAVVASAAGGVGERLARIDADLTARLTGAAEMAVERALERAVNRTRNRARRTEHAAATRGPARGVLARIGETGRAALDLDPTGLVTDADFDQLHDQWDTWVAAAWAAAVAEVDTAGPDPVEVRDPAEDFDAGWLILLAGLVAGTRGALLAATDPTTGGTPGGSTDGVADLVGETDPTAIVQPGLIRQATARAGGALGATTDGGAVLVDGGIRPAGGVATGEQILAAAAEAGLALTGWTWLTGTPARPFPPHQSLSGVSFAQWDDPALANEAGQWPGVSHFRPGDHRGCRCTAQPNLDPISPN